MLSGASLSSASQLVIRHATAYAYAQSPESVVQMVRLTPSDGAGQRVVHWRVGDESGVVPFVFRDGFGNVCHFFGGAGRGASLHIVAEGVVETSVVRPAGMPVWYVEGPRNEPLAPAFFLRTTARTEPDAALRAFAQGVRAELPAAWRGDAWHEGMRLAERVCERIAHRAGATTVGTRAEEAFEASAGVCQDRAHVMLALARALGHPARYVSGYWYGAALEDAGAMHAWAEIWHVEQGWIAIDPSQGIETSPAHVRVAVGLDYTDAAPLRGVRRGGSGETLDVAVAIERRGEQGNQ